MLRGNLESKTRCPKAESKLLGNLIEQMDWVWGTQAVEASEEKCQRQR